MDLDTETLKLILALSRSEAQDIEENPEIARNHQRVEDLLNELRNRGHATHIKMGKITVRHDTEILSQVDAKIVLILIFF